MAERYQGIVHSRDHAGATHSQDSLNFAREYHAMRLAMMQAQEERLQGRRRTGQKNNKGKKQKPDYSARPLGARIEDIIGREKTTEFIDAFPYRQESSTLVGKRQQTDQINQDTGGLSIGAILEAQPQRFTRSRSRR